MRSTEIDRRTLLAMLAGTAAAPLAPALAAVPGAEPLYLAARRSHGDFEVAVIDEKGQVRLVVPLEARGHSFAIDAAHRKATAFARQPGRFAVTFDIDGRGEPAPFHVAEGRHFFGHGVFADGGRLMLATENDYEAGHGVVGVYDASGGMTRIGEFPSDGIGPHEVVSMPDGRTLCVANGGILTHPDYDRIKLNLDTMSPSLAYLDIETGDVVERAELLPELHQLSIRHMAVDGFGTVWFGCQYQGPAADRPPLVGRHRRGRAPELFTGPMEMLRRFDNYVGSVAVDGSGTIVATSSPRGGLVAFWDASTGRCLGSRDMVDGCGVAPHGGGSFLMTSGTGRIAETGPEVAPETKIPGEPELAWDNHLRLLADS